MSSSTQSNPSTISLELPSASDKDAVRFMDLIRFGLRNWLLIGFLTFVFGVAGVAASFLVTPVYAVETSLAHVSDEEQRGLLSAISNQFGALGGLAGLPVSSSGEQEAYAILRSKAITGELIAHDNLLPVLFADKWDTSRNDWLAEVEDPPSEWDGIRLLQREIFSFDENQRTGLITVVARWEDPVQAANWLHDLVRLTNERIRTRDLEHARESLKYLENELQKVSVIELKQSMYGLVESFTRREMLAKIRDQYAFAVVDPPLIPDPGASVSPVRILWLILGLGLGGFLGALLAFYREQRNGGTA